jgi:hypothetical protein
MRAIESHVRGLDRALTGPGRLKADMLREVRHGLVDAAEAYEAEGDADPERRAIAEFGAVPEVAPAYQAELATSATRSVALAALWLGSRSGRTTPMTAMRLVNRGLAVLLVVAWAVGVAMFAWSAVLWHAALSWPPMIAGTVLMSAATLWIARAVRPGLAATRVGAGQPG